MAEQERPRLDASKRVFDVLLAGGGLLLLFPILLTVAFMVRLSMGSPVLFRQDRPGLLGRPFTLYKFRTMKDAVDRNGHPLPDAERLTGFGRFLRATSLDELPELWNVLRGDMSLVGPRPLLMEYLDLYTPSQARRHLVRPGITGWAQINGRNTLGWKARLKSDAWYVDHRTLRLDVWILLVTVWKVLAREGVTQEGHATMEPFRGEEDADTPGGVGA